MRDCSNIKLIIGLGNIGAEYANTRHNIGFMVVDRILSKLNGEITEVHGCKSTFFRTGLKGRKILLQKPETYMNLSGEAVLSIMNKEKISIEEILIIHDELDLEFGTLKLKRGGSSGGHNGIKSIIENLNGNQNFLRLRVGISRDKNVVDYVLGEFKDSEKLILDELIETAAQAAIASVSMGVGNAMNKFNSTNLNKKEILETE
jgi:PTH1 family peptidyl-tRNA hydrolase